MTGLVLGPLLRYVDETTASVWVEVDDACRVSVLGATTPTFCVHGHHYALVEVTGLSPGSSVSYTVELDGETVWPAADSGLPPSRIRTLDPDRPLRLVFGSCRMSVPNDTRHNRIYGVDVLRAYARRMAMLAEEDWPIVLLLVGDQVYADETSDEMRAFIRTRRDIDIPPGREVADFEEYTRLYRLAWSEPWIRWLLSTVPSAMIFDDHDVRDDWNISEAWRQQMAAQSWWRSRITGGLAAYWIYQHLGNLSADERASDPLFAAVRAADGDAGSKLDDFAWTADQDPPANRWSYAREFGRVRLVVLDSRCGRVVDRGRRTMLDDAEWAWFQQQICGEVDHLLIGTSLPFLLPKGLHHVESWNEAVADGAWGRWAARLAEGVRQAIDLEHWAAFRGSFDAMATVVQETATGRRGRPPATVTFLSGDVHYSYAASATYDKQTPETSRVYQLVCSPIRNPLGRWLRYANGLASFGLARLVGRVLARTARVPTPSIDWSVDVGPRFDNALATLDIVERDTAVRWDTATVDSEGDTNVVELSRTRL